MYGVLAGDLAGFPYEYQSADLTDRALALFPEAPETAAPAKEHRAGNDAAPDGEDSAGGAGILFSDRTVLTAAMEEGLLRFEKRIAELFSGKQQPAGSGKTGEAQAPAAEGGGEQPAEKSAGRADGNRSVPKNAFEEAYREEVTGALRRNGQAYPLAGYAMDLSIWLFREGAAPAEEPDAGPAARAVPVAWMFQEDLYMMRHMARLQAQCTHRDQATIRAAEAAACAVFLALHGQTKEYIAQYLERGFRYRRADEKGMRREILLAGPSWSSGASGLESNRTDGSGTGADASPGNPAGGGMDESRPALIVRAALTAFLYGRDFEDVLRRAVSLGGHSSSIAAVAGGMAEAYFGMPEEIREQCRQLLPAALREKADAFAARMQQKKAMREADPALQSRWESALTRASERHPAAVQGNEPLEKVLEIFRQKKDRQSFVTALETLRLRMEQKGRVFVPLLSARNAGTAAAAGENGQKGAEQKETMKNAVTYRMQAIRTKDGKLWQPAYTSRQELDRAVAAVKGTAQGSDSGMVLSYAMDALFKRFLPVGEQDAVPEAAPAQIEGILLNPYGNRALFLPRKTIEALFRLEPEAGGVRTKE